jgi:hypothetical protein
LREDQHKKGSYTKDTMPRRTAKRLFTRVTPMRRNRRSTVNTLFVENVVLPCPMSSTINNFPWAYNKITPTLAGSVRAVNLIRLELQIPPVAAAGIFQLLLVDPVDDSIYPVITGKQLSTTNMTRINYSIPRKYMRYQLPNSTQIAFNFTIRYTTNQTFTSNVMAKMVYRLVPDSIAVPPGVSDDFENISLQSPQ